MALLRLPALPGPWPLWHIAGVAVDAFADQPQTRAQWPVARRLCLRMVLTCSVFAGTVRTNPAGSALCLLSGVPGRPRWKGPLLTVLLFLVASALVAAVSLIFWVVAGLVAGFFGPQWVLSVRSRRARRVLIHGSPRDPYVGVHTVASVAPGEGRKLLLELNAEADEKGWTLVLDAANSALAGYYAGLGYTAIAGPVRMPWNESVVRMCRRPAPSRGGPR
jgi:hypothetical protein